MHDTQLIDRVAEGATRADNRKDDLKVLYMIICTEIRNAVASFNTCTQA